MVKPYRNLILIQTLHIQTVDRQTNIPQNDILFKTHVTLSHNIMNRHINILQTPNMLYEIIRLENFKTMANVSFVSCLELSREHRNRNGLSYKTTHV